MEGTLKATNEVLFANRPTDTVQTTVDYDSESDAKVSVWRRFVGGSFTKEDLLDALLPNSTAEDAEKLEKKGTRLTPPLTPGQVMEYILTFPNNDPNIFLEGIIVRIYALLSSSTAELRIQHPDDFVETGGTYHFRRI